MCISFALTSPITNPFINIRDGYPEGYYQRDDMCCGMCPDVEGCPSRAWCDSALKLCLEQCQKHERNELTVEQDLLVSPSLRAF